MKKYLLFSSLFFALCGTAQNSLPVKKVTVFKNATALMIKEGSATIKDGAATLPIPAQALWGTYFVGTTKENGVKNLVFRNDTLKRQDNSRSIWQFIAGNLNKPVTIFYTPTQGVDKSATGKVTDYNLYSGMMTFVTDAGKTFVMHVGSVYQADFAGEPSKTYMADSIKRMIVLKPEKVADNIQLQEVYMTSGINWIPSYFLKLKDDKNGRLEMKATLENSSGDLKETETELVVGAPQMAYSGKPDPMTYDYLSLGNFDNNINRGDFNSNYLQSNAIQAKSFGGTPAYFETDGVMIDGEKAGDMYIYKLGKISLPRDTKGTFPIFVNSVEYKDKYEGSIPDVTNYYNTHFCPPDERLYDIFHSLEIKNTTSVPFTTASVMVINDKDQFVAQDQMKYTPVGATTNVRLSKAIDIIMKNTEEEKNREDNAKKIAKTNYSKVVLKGTINAENYQDKEVTVTITKNINGNVLSESDGGKASKLNSYNYINPLTEIKWEVKLGANEKKVLNYEYEVYFTP